MGVEENKALVRRFYDELWSKGNVEVASEVFLQDYVRHDLRPTQAHPGPAGQAKIATGFRAAFPDLRMELDLILAEGDLVAARWTTEGTNTGPWSGQDATGKRARFSGVNIFASVTAGRRAVEPPRRPRPDAAAQRRDLRGRRPGRRRRLRSTLGSSGRGPRVRVERPRGGVLRAHQTFTLRNLVLCDGRRAIHGECQQSRQRSVRHPGPWQGSLEAAIARARL